MWYWGRCVCGRVFAISITASAGWKDAPGLFLVGGGCPVECGVGHNELDKLLRLWNADVEWVCVMCNF